VAVFRLGLPQSTGRINAVMFVVVLGAELFARATTLVSDWLDNLGNALTDALGLFVAHESARSTARVARFNLPESKTPDLF